MFLNGERQHHQLQYRRPRSEYEILWVNIEIASCKPLYIHVQSYYRPTTWMQKVLSSWKYPLINKLQQGNSDIWLAGDMRTSVNLR